MRKFEIVESRKSDRPEPEFEVPLIGGPLDGGSVVIEGNRFRDIFIVYKKLFRTHVYQLMSGVYRYRHALVLERKSYEWKSKLSRVHGAL
ncbi:hypothetical protein [Gimesia aquarii]|uniref:Uncharacterized protein n=1 Tax=Gimesia aquarii TaxID=2527964 RepID=A0A517VP75_9PLAN|nr:hypothetical protein [Gimesia aquarii]QDT94809.1 hypothetical protein V144x_02410 [Gimesia aquarii]